MTIHIGAEPGQIAETVLMPGDPYRARWAAETFLEGVELVEKLHNSSMERRSLRLSKMGEEAVATRSSLFNSGNTCVLVSFLNEELEFDRCTRMTSTLQLSFVPVPSFVCTVIVVVPTPTGITFPV